MEIRMTDIYGKREGEVFGVYVEARKCLDGKIKYSVQGRIHGSPVSLDLSHFDMSFAKAWKLKEELQIKIDEAQKSERERLKIEMAAYSLNSSVASIPPKSTTSGQSRSVEA